MNSDSQAAARQKFHQALALHQQGQWGQAQALYQDILQSAPEHFHALRLLALLLMQQNQPVLALELFERALNIHPDHVEVLSNRGIVLRHLKRPADALASYERALRTQPNDVATLNNRGSVLVDLGLYQAALASFHQAIACQADCTAAHMNLGTCHLLMGNLELGWRAHEWRLKRENSIALMQQFPQALWQGLPLERGRLLVWGEQGLGEQILCLSMLPSVLERVADLTVAVEPRLVSLVQRSFAQVKTVTQGPQLTQEPCDSHIPMLSLGQYLRNHWQDFSTQPRAYLKTDPVRSAQLRTQLTTRKPRVCGISWLSHSPHMGASKSLPLSHLKPLFALQAFEFVDLQYGDTRVQRQALAAELSVKVLHVQDIDNSNDIDGLAALIDACDVVVTVSNTTAHLAAALGKPVYVLLPYAHGLLWYWHEGRANSPWYPSARLYRQEKAGEWGCVLERVVADLRQFINATNPTCQNGAAPQDDFSQGF